MVSTVDVSDLSHFIYDRDFIRETLAYTSPEQTGRISHRVTFASDLYSLGVVFYEMLSRRLPFYSDDPLELIHSHLAQEAPALHEIDKSIPPTLGRIVAKLMLKEPEKRYQSSKSLLNDLDRCRDEYLATGKISDFPLAASFGATRVTFISKMVGRDEEAKLILKEYEDVTSGEFRALFISGLSGIGKTRLIQELQRPIVEHKGYFTSGKFDFYQRNLPYSALIQAFRGLLRTFLTESDRRVQEWKNKLQEAVGQNGKILTDVIPELEVLIGPQPEVRPIPPVEARNRFHDVFDRFLTCLASSDNPLTLFIDDLQWCDTASLEFLSYVLANRSNHPYLFFIGAYRSNEVDPSHLLAKVLMDARKSCGEAVKEVGLGPLRPEHCHEMVSYILDSPLEQTKTLSDFINTLSEGNPLFVNESLSYLYNEDLLYMDENRQWRWDLDKVRRSNMPTTVVALFSSKIERLPPRSLDLLEYCACMGNTLAASQLAEVKEISVADVYETLKPALRQGLLVETKNELRFIHDKVHEAVLSAIPLERRREIHWRVGNHLLAPLLAESVDLEKAESLFAIVTHLNMGAPESLDKKTAYLLSDLTYHAGNKALASLATEAANGYFRASRALLSEDCWEEPHYERTFRILQRSARTELMCGNYEISEKILATLLKHAKSDLDRAECLAEQTTSLSSIGNFRSAIETANRGLAYFGKAIPMDPEEADRRGRQLIAEISATGGDIWQTILNKPFATDRKSKIELAFYSELIPDLYMSGLVPQLYLSAAQSTKHCLEGGMDESVIYSFTIMGLQLGEREEFELAFKYEDLARELSAKYPNTFGATRGMNGIVWCNMHSRSRPSEIVDYCLKSIQCGKNCGDLYNAGLSYGPLMWNLAIQGADLRAVEDYANECMAFSQKYHLSFSVGLAEAVREGWIDPMKRGHVKIPMQEKLKQWEDDHHIASAGSFHVLSSMTHYYFGEYREAQHHLQEVEKYLAGLTDNVLKRIWYVFRALNRLRLLGTCNGGAQNEDDLKKALDDIRPLVEKVNKWAGLGPLLKPYKAFLEAEIARVTSPFKEARSSYLDAIDVAREHGYTLLEGHLWECLAELILENGRGIARPIVSEAARLYRKCHADRKETALMDRFPECFLDQHIIQFINQPPKENGESSLPLTGDEPVTRVLPDLDVQYLMKACHICSKYAPGRNPVLACD